MVQLGDFWTPGWQLELSHLIQYAVIRSYFFMATVIRLARHPTKDINLRTLPRKIRYACCSGYVHAFVCNYVLSIHGHTGIIYSKYTRKKLCSISGKKLEISVIQKKLYKIHTLFYEYDVIMIIYRPAFPIFLQFLFSMFVIEPFLRCFASVCNSTKRVMDTATHSKVRGVIKVYRGCLNYRSS